MRTPPVRIIASPYASVSGAGSACATRPTMEGSVDSGQDNVGSDHLGKLHQSYWGDRFGRGYVAEQGSRGNDAGRAALKRRWSQAVSGSGFTVTPPATAGLSLQGQQFVVEHEQMPRCIFRCSATNCCISAGKYTLIGGVVPDVELISCGLQHARCGVGVW